MPGIPQPFPVPLPVSDLTMWNAIRVAFVNLNHAGAITYDPLAVPHPPVSMLTMLNAVRLAAGGELQT